MRMAQQGCSISPISKETRIQLGEALKNTATPQPTYDCQLEIPTLCYYALLFCCFYLLPLRPFPSVLLLLLQLDIMWAERINFSARMSIWISKRTWTSLIFYLPFHIYLLMRGSFDHAFWVLFGASLTHLITAPAKSLTNSYVASEIFAYPLEFSLLCNVMWVSWCMPRYYQYFSGGMDPVCIGLGNNGRISSQNTHKQKL